MNTKGKGKVITGIAMAAIMLASVFAAMVPTGIAVSEGDNFNHISDTAPSETVLVGQNVQFWDDNVTVQKMEDNVWYYYDGPWTDGKAYNVNWDPALTLRATYSTDNTSLAVKDPSVPLKLKVGTKEVSSLTLGTNLIIDTGGINLFDLDKVDLEIIGPVGKLTIKNNQVFSNITVADLREFGNTTNTSALINTTGWNIGVYTFQVKTKSAYACGLDASSGVKELRIIKGEIAISAETTTVTELETLKLTVTGVSNDTIWLNATSPHVLFQGGVENTPIGAEGQNNFTDKIDEDGKRTYIVQFDETGSYTIKVTVKDGPRKDDYDTVDITVSEKGVTFDLPMTVVVGQKLTIRGTASSGTSVDIYVDKVLYKKLDDLILEDGEFSEEVTVGDEIGMGVPGTVRLKAWIDGDYDVVAPATKNANVPTDSADGEAAFLLTEPGLTVETSVAIVAQDDSFYVTGTAKGARSVDILTVAPKGTSGKGMDSSTDYTGITKKSPSVSVIDDTFSQKIPVDGNADTGTYLVAVFSAGRDGYYGTTVGATDLLTEIDLNYGDLGGKTQEQFVDMLRDLATQAGADDLMWMGAIKVEAAKVELNPITDVALGAPLNVSGTTNREDGHIMLITVKGPVELTPQTASVESDGTFSASFDTTDAEVGTYTVTVDDGDGHTDDATVEIVEEIVPIATATPTAAPTAAPTAVPTAEPTAEPTPTPTEEPGFEAVFAIAGLLSIAYLVLRRRK